jgi:hypothetical protein
VIPLPRREDGDDAWFQAEQPIRYAIVEELQRIKRRSRARMIPIVLIAAALTAAVIYKRSKKVRMHEAEVVIAVTEGSLSSGHIPMPVMELREYIASVLLSNQVIEQIIVDEDLFPLRKKLGMQFAINEFRDMFEIGVHRNYFLSEYSIDSPRSARISIELSHTDPRFANRMAHRIAELIVVGEQAHRQAVADEIARQAGMALETVRAEAVAVEQEVADRGLAVAEAEHKGLHRVAGALKITMHEAEAKLREAEKTVNALSKQANAEEMAAEIDRAGLGMRFDIVDAKTPLDEPGAGLYFQVIVGGFVFFVVLPLVALFVGAFDTRIHDREDAERLGLPVLGHLPPFPGDGVGSLRARGLRGRRVPS